MKEPTEAQIKELWEQCGFQPFKNRPKSELPYSWDGWELPDSIFEVSKLPPPDLNNLFKHAVPKLIYFSFLYDSKLKYLVSVDMGEDVGMATANDKDPALALFWAIYKVINIA